MVFEKEKKLKIIFSQKFELREKSSQKFGKIRISQTIEISSQNEKNQLSLRFLLRENLEIETKKFFHFFFLFKKKTKKWS